MRFTQVRLTWQGRCMGVRERCQTKCQGLVLLVMCQEATLLTACPLADQSLSLHQAVAAAKSVWGERALQDLLTACPLADQRASLRQAVAAAKSAWGERALQDLEAEDRLSVACEKAPTSDPVIGKLRAAFQVRCQPRCWSLLVCGCCVTSAALRQWRIAKLRSQVRGRRKHGVA